MNPPANALYGFKAVDGRTTLLLYESSRVGVGVRRATMGQQDHNTQHTTLALVHTFVQHCSRLN